MHLLPGTRLGPYEIVAPIGAGGMGEVYRAHDTRLNRDVAVKVLPPSFASDAERMQRFTLEARAAGSLNHPNILTIYDIGTQDRIPYLVSELLEGETIAKRLGSGAVPERESIDYASQMALGLAAAHARGIVHRDIKPANIFITDDRRIKILDFGIAKQSAPSTTATGDNTMTALPDTQPGMVIGSAGYMSPEQVRGVGVDHRTDIFSLGVVLYELLSARRAFQGETAIETLNAILKEEPPELSGPPAGCSPALRRIVRRCMEKKAADRFQSAQDISYFLQSVSDLGTGLQPAKPVGREPAKSPLAWAAAALAACLAIGGAYWLGSSSAKPVLAAYQFVPLNRGPIRTARFTPDGSAILAGVAAEGGVYEIFSVKPGGAAPRSLGIKDADVLAVSSRQQLAVALGFRNNGIWGGSGKLASVPLEGSAPRELLDQVAYADWSPDGSSLAVVRRRDGKGVIEFPPGNVLVESAVRGGFSSPRFSRDGKTIAFFEHPVSGDNLGSLAIVDLNRKKTVLTGNFESTQGIAWHPTTHEIWFGSDNTLRAIRPGSKARVVQNYSDYATIEDIDARGRVLLGFDDIMGGIVFRGAHDERDRELPGMAWPQAGPLSTDGSLILTSHTFGDYPITLRKTDGSAPVIIGSGAALAISPDGKWILAAPRPGSPIETLIVPTGAGQTSKLALPGALVAGEWLPDGRRLVVTLREQGKPLQTYLQDLNDGAPVGKAKPIAPPGFRVGLMRPDGVAFLCYRAGVFLCPLDGSAPQPFRAALPTETVLSWSEDGKFIHLAGADKDPIKVWKVEVASLKRQLWREIKPAERFAILAYGNPRMDRSGTRYAYQYRRKNSWLSVAEGLR